MIAVRRSVQGLCRAQHLVSRLLVLRVGIASACPDPRGDRFGVRESPHAQVVRSSHSKHPYQDAKRLKSDRIALMGQIRRLGSEGRWQEVLKALELAAFPLDVKIYSAAINAMIPSKQWEAAVGLLARMRRDGVAPNEYTYSSLIKVCNCAREFDRALAFLEEMKSEGVVPDLVFYLTAIDACAKSGRWEKAIALFEELKGLGIKPTLEVYNSLINALGKSRKLDQACKYFLVMIEDGVEPDDRTYNTLIDACTKSGEWQEAARVFDVMLENKVKPNENTYKATAAGGSLFEWHDR